VRNTTPSWGRPPQAYIMKVSWLIEAIIVASTKNLSILFYFYLFCPGSLCQPPILFSLRPCGGLRRSRWPCRPRTTLRLVPPDGVTPGGATQGDRREFAHYLEAGGQTATHRGGTASHCSPTVRPPARPIRSPAPGTEALGPISGTCGCVHVTAAKLWRQHTRCKLTFYPFIKGTMRHKAL
jgi:hypothetical protein